MLEHAALLVRPGDASGRRLILVADSGELAGFARWRTGGGWRLLGPAVLEVREHEDEPLLCTLRRCWTLLPWYEVRDAEDHRIGRTLGAVIEDRDDCRFAVRREEGPGQCTFQSRDGTPLAQLSAETEGLRLTFAGIIEREPFVKMLLLGAVLLR